MTEQEPLAAAWGAGPEGPASARLGDAAHHPPRAGRFHEEPLRLPTDQDAKLASLRGAMEEGAARGWRLLIATKQQGADVLLVTWDTQGFLVD